MIGKKKKAEKAEYKKKGKKIKIEALYMSEDLRLD